MRTAMHAPDDGGRPTSELSLACYARHWLTGGLGVRVHEGRSFALPLDCAVEHSPRLRFKETLTHPDRLRRTGTILVTDYLDRPCGVNSNDVEKKKNKEKLKKSFERKPAAKRLELLTLLRFRPGVFLVASPLNGH